MLRFQREPKASVILGVSVFPTVGTVAAEFRSSGGLKVQNEVLCIVERRGLKMTEGKTEKSENFPPPVVHYGPAGRERAEWVNRGLLRGCIDPCIVLYIPAPGCIFSIPPEKRISAVTAFQHKIL